jgi:hypothetical protein
MRNEYETPDAVDVGEAQSLILGAKGLGGFDTITQQFGTYVMDPSTDIDE